MTSFHVSNDNVMAATHLSMRKNAAMTQG